MTPVYLSPDLAQVETMHSALAKRDIPSKIIRKRNPGNAVKSSENALLYELWLTRSEHLNKARSVIVQVEFESLRNHIHSEAQKQPVETPAPLNTIDPKMLNPLLKQAMKLENITRGSASKNSSNYYEEWIPINHIRVFHRIGKLLGFSEEQIEKYTQSKLYRPWNSEPLMKSVEDLKRKVHGAKPNTKIAS